jgi:hypothetical protein
MQTIKGRLLYMGWFNLPWKLVTDSGEIDLWPIIEGFFVSFNGKTANHERRRDSYTLSSDEGSKFKFEYVPDEHVWLEEPAGGLSNVHAYLDESLVWLSGRMVEIEIEDGKHIKLVADRAQKVNGIYSVGDSCEVPRGAEKTICKAGQRDCCIFLAMSPDGFECEKFSGSTARMLLDRLAKGTMRASRIGDCALVGRKERRIATA